MSADIGADVGVTATATEGVDAIGGSSAGVYVNNRVKVASLFRGVSPEDFVRAYEAAESVQEVADKLGMTIMAVHSRAAHYRREYSVPLKKMAGQRSKVDAEGLRNLCAEIQTPPANGESHAGEKPAKKKRVRVRKKKAAEVPA